MILKQIEIVCSIPQIEVSYKNRPIFKLLCSNILSLYNSDILGLVKDYIS